MGMEVGEMSHDYSQNHYGDNTHDPIEKYFAGLAKKIISLEQQLAERDVQLLKNADLLDEAADALDNMEKQNVLLRDLIDHILNTYHVPRVPRITEALNATADLAGLVVCDAEPVGSVADDCNGFPWKKINYVSERLLSELPIGTKLYVAKGQK
jgi:hypothetical protein